MQKLVNSFDIFDTIIGRICGHPEGIFCEVSKIINYPDYVSIRKLSENKSNGTWMSIWENFAKISGLSNSEIENIQNLEWSIEQSYSFPILVNSILLKNNNNILVSDMYLSENMIKQLLDIHNIKNYNKIYVTPNGKRSGYIWSQIKNDGFIIDHHTGDNYECDILSAKRSGIKANFFEKDYNLPEKYLISKGYDKLSNLCRITRLSNPYGSNQSHEFNYWHRLSNILPVYRIIFSTVCKKYYIDVALSAYEDYSTNFDSYHDYYTNVDIKNIIECIDSITDIYIKKLKIDINSYTFDDNLIHYLKTYCKIKKYDIL